MACNDFPNNPNVDDIYDTGSQKYRWDGFKWVPEIPAGGGGGDSYWEPGTNPDDIVNSNTGNVGIGTATPTAKLEVSNDAGTDTITLSPGTAGATSNIGVSNSTFGFGNATYTGASHTFVAGTTQRMKIFGPGENKVVIGDVAGASNALEVDGNVTARNSSGVGNFLAGNWQGPPTAGVVLGRVTFQGTTNDGATIQTGARVQAQARDSWVDNVTQSCELSFWTCPVNGTSPLKRTTIGTDGIVSGLFSDAGVHNSDSKLAVVSALPGTPDPNTLYFIVD